MRGRLSALMLALGAAACADTSPDAARDTSEITTVSPPPPVQQSIANCWVFATNAWIEALSARPVGGTQVDLSEAYVSFLYWLDQISAPGALEHPIFTLRATGSWGTAADLLTRFGWMTEEEFLTTLPAGTFAERHQQAFEAVQHELTRGVLQTPAARADRKLVAETLATAWHLEPRVVADMTKAFDDTFTRTFVTGTATHAKTRIKKLEDITVGYGTDGRPVTAQDLIGSLAEGSDAYRGERTGPYAYSDVKPPGSEDKVRGYLRRIQRSLVQDLPVVMSETSDDDAIDATGTYQKPADGVLSDQWYDHAVMVFDLSVQTPHFGLLPAGVAETRPEAIADSLTDDAVIKTFRARNSYWGRYANGAVIPFAGGVAVTDFTLDYLLWRPSYAGPRILMRTTIPNDPEMVIAKSP
ncbi:MAG: hypothetical protein KIT84_21440 [Labilithrix sp.]|nr:hypothetical protein [Labilithrix sp.]MCW5813608.1 hypothetical protein [Labilithrix sp.]